MRRASSHGLALLATLLVLAGPAMAQRAPSTRASAAALEAARRYLCPNGGTPQRAVNGRRGGRCVPATGGFGDDSEMRGWDTGIAPPNRAQAPCPAGTVAAPSAQAGATRCVPG